MTNYLVETFYTCTFKIVHKLDKLNEKALSELENRKDGKVEIIDVKLNNRKTKTINKKKMKIFLLIDRRQKIFLIFRLLLTKKLLIRINYKTQMN